MVGGLKIIRVKSGKEQAFEKLFRDLRSEMWNEETGCLLFSLLRSRESSSLYTVQEQYLDAEAMERHNTSAHVAKFAPKLAALIENAEEAVFDVVVE